MNKKFAVGLLFFAAVYIALFVRLPQLDYLKSGYAVQCELPGFRVSLMRFSEFPGTSVKVSIDAPGHKVYEFTDPTLKVLAQSICDAGVYPSNPDQYAQSIENMPRDQFSEILSQKPHYYIDLERKVFSPTLKEVIVRLVLLALLVLVAVLFRPKNK